MLLERWGIEAQRALQSALASGVRAIKQGQPGTLFARLAVCLSYGVRQNPGLPSRQISA